MDKVQNIFSSHRTSVDSLKNLTDEKLYELCKQYGERARMWKQKFAGLLPEVFRRRLYEKKGYGSIFEFAAKLAGMSADQVRLILNLEKRLEDKPVLKQLLVNGEVSMHKLARVVSIATVENQESLAEQVKLLPQKVLETLVRDEKTGMADTALDENHDGSPQPLFGTESLRARTLLAELGLESDVIEELHKLKIKGININEILRKTLQKRELEIAQEKEKIAAEIQKKSGKDQQQSGQPALMHEKQDKSHSQKNTQKKVSRYIPAKIKKLIQKEHGSKCSIQTCNKPSKDVHHTQRFSLAKNHNPHYLAPLCRDHHTIAHSIDMKFHENRSRFIVIGT